MSSLDFDSNTIEMEVKKEVVSNEEESGIEFIPDISRTSRTQSTSASLYHFVPDMEIKHEEVDFHDNSTTQADSEIYLDQDLGKMSSKFDNSSVRAEEKDINDKYLDLLQCQRDCETCQRYLNLLSEHIRSTHCPPQPTQDHPQIDPLDVDTEPPPTELSSSVQIKCEDDENIHEVVCSQEEDLRPGFESEIESERHTGNTPSPHHHLTPNIIRRRSTKKKSCTDSKSSKAKNRTPPSQRQFKCEDCDKFFSRKFNLVAHKRSHTGERPHKCDTCEKRFSRSTDLRKHKRIHTGEKPYKCEQCEMSFSNPSNLSTHQRMHAGEKLYECDVCGYRFLTSSVLCRHKRIHTGEKPYQCEECGKRFAQTSTLSNHKRVHTGDKPYKCTLCGKSFSIKNTLTGHMRTHTGERPYACVLCEKRFTNSRSLTFHKKMHAGKTSQM